MQQIGIWAILFQRLTTLTRNSTRETPFATFVVIFQIGTDDFFLEGPRHPFELAILLGGQGRKHCYGTVSQTEGAVCRVSPQHLGSTTCYAARKWALQHEKTLVQSLRKPW
jgi:hypothetical protein